MRIKYFEYLIDLHNTLSMSKTAERFFTTHQSIGNAISALEKDLKQPLIQRTPKGISFTEIGESVYEYALQIIENKNQIIKLCENYQNLSVENVTGIFDIFIIPRFSNTQFFKVYQALNRTYPQLELSLKTISVNTFFKIIPIQKPYCFLSFIDEDNFKSEKYNQLLKEKGLICDVIKAYPLGICYKKNSKFESCIKSKSLQEIMNCIPVTVNNYSFQEDLFFEKNMAVSTIYTIDDFAIQKRLIKNDKCITLCTHNEFNHLFSDKNHSLSFYIPKATTETFFTLTYQKELLDNPDFINSFILSFQNIYC